MAVNLKVIDVSEHQGKIDWETVINHIDGAILRCGYGDDIESQDDKQFARNLAECERLGIPHGVYLYSYADTEAHAKSELQHILRLIKGHNFEMPIYLDCEQAGTEKFAPTACKIVCEGIKAAGFTPGVYASLSWWNNYLTSVTEYSRWVAQWSSKLTYAGKCDMWQYSETGKVLGISGSVDMNYCYTEFEKIGEDESKPSEDESKPSEGESKPSEGESKPIGSTPNIKYQVYTDKSGWLPVVTNLEDYAGMDGEPVKGIRVSVNGDTVAVDTHQLNNGNIDKLTVYAGKHTVKYRVRPIGSKDYLDWMENKKDTGGSADTYAGISGKAIDRVQMVIK